MGHVGEHQALAHLQGLVETVVAYHITRQAGKPSQTVAVGEGIGLPGAKNVGAVGHFQDVGHMAGSRGVENGLLHLVPGDIQYLGHQDPGSNRHSLTGFKVDLNIVFSGKRLDARHQVTDLVTGPGDVMAAPEINPFHARQQVPEFCLHCIQGALQRWKILLAKGVKMQAAYALQGGFVQL